VYNSFLFVKTNPQRTGKHDFENKDLYPLPKLFSKTFFFFAKNIYIYIYKPNILFQIHNIMIDTGIQVCPYFKCKIKFAKKN